jgi:AcrR family transcriptional regulator
MPRVQASDYDEKKSKILDAAATLFAQRGYAGSKMEHIAEARGVAKSMLYHYFKRKEDVLFGILQDHIFRLQAVVTHYLEGADRSNRYQLLRGFVEVYLEPTRQNRARHLVALHDMRYLIPAQKQKQIKDERAFLELVEGILHDVDPRLAKQDLKVHALLLMGMLNSIEIWFRQRGRLTSQELVDIVVRHFLTGPSDDSKLASTPPKRTLSKPMHEPPPAVRRSSARSGNAKRT